MSLLLGQILTLLTTPPGNLIYHIVLVFSIAGALLGAVHSLRSSNFPQKRRTVIGLGIMLGLQLVLFVISGLTLKGLLNSQIVFPPLDRAVTLLTLVWIVWLWVFPEPLSVADVATLLLNLLGVTVLGFTLILWAQNPASSFNLSWFETGWQSFSIAVILLGILGLVIRKPNGWNYGLAMLILGLLGHLLSLLYPIDGNFPGFVRLAQLGMFPFLLTLSKRFPAPTHVKRPVFKPQKPDEPFQERRRYSTDPKTFHALMALAAEADSNKIGQALARGIAQAMLADLCFLITLGEDKAPIISCGYDLIREEDLGGTTIDRDSIPLLANAIQRGRPIRLPASSTSSDLKSLGKILSLSNPGNLLSVPVTSPKCGPLGSVLILSPYTNRLWSAEDQAYLSNVSSLFIPILERNQRASALENERDRSVKEANNVMEQATEAKQKFEQMATELAGQREKFSQLHLQTGNMAALLIIQEEAQNTIAQLKAENERLRNAGGAPSAANDQMERELRQTLEEMAHMQNALAEANNKILELEKRPTAPATEKMEVIASILRELRQSMTSIVGYTDLLMGESVGNLGALQRKFIERIKASTEQVSDLMDDLIQATNLDAGKAEFKLQPIHPNLIVDSAMTNSSTQIRGKNITLQLDITDTALRIQTDRDALQQILIHLLQNATAATQKQGNITLWVQLDDEEDNHERDQRASTLVIERDWSAKEAHNVMEGATEAKKKFEQIVTEQDGQREKFSQLPSQAEKVAALLIIQEEARKTIAQLKAENERLRNAGGAPSASNGQMERELRQTLEEMAHMQNALAEANNKILELEKHPTAPTTEKMEVIASISQELRQPMTSIVGYTDLLMGESVGILGALQRKFIERIKASTERIGSLVDDLIQSSILDAGKAEFKPQPIDLNLIIDNAMAYTSTQIREKNITLRLDLPVTAPRIQTDRDALQQILIHLLQNATAATQTEGNITLRVQMQQEEDNHFLSIQVTDNGGGIASEDIPRVFARRYRADHDLIQGLGDTGVGLSIARALVEAQNGRIWVQTETGVGSTFSVLMPVVVELPVEN